MAENKAHPFQLNKQARAEAMKKLANAQKIKDLPNGGKSMRSRAN